MWIQRGVRVSGLDRVLPRKAYLKWQLSISEGHLFLLTISYSVPSPSLSIFIKKVPFVWNTVDITYFLQAYLVCI